MTFHTHILWRRCSLLAMLLCLTACLGAQNLPEIDRNYPQQPPQRQVVRVLSIGNSFSQDAFSYVPFIIQELAPQMQVDWGIMYIGGCSLARHWDCWTGNKPDYLFHRFRTGDEHWSTERNVSLRQALEAQQWDIVIYQQQSGQSRYYHTYQPHLALLMNAVHQALPTAAPAWLLTQAYGEGYDKLGTMSSDEMWARVATSSLQAIEEMGIRLLIPAGTAIQNARYTQLDRFGKARHLVYDGYHLHEGIAPLIEGLCTAQVVLRYYGVEVDVEQSHLQITPEWHQARHIPGAHGQPEEATPEDYTLARRCAKLALDGPMQLTIIQDR